MMLPLKRVFWHNVTVPSISGTETWEGLIHRRLESLGSVVITRETASLAPSVRVPEGTICRIDGEHVDRVPFVEVAFFYWRWPMPEPKYADRHQAYLNQISYITAYLNLGIPVIVFDGDHKISDEEVRGLVEMGVRVYAPELLPGPGKRTLMYPHLFDTHTKRTTPTFTRRPYYVGYVGNNYERYEQARRLLGGHDAPDSHIWGNWLDEGPGREAPETVKRDFPRARFHGKLPNDQVISALAKSWSTVHLAKPSYCDRGFVTIRWAEAVLAGTFGFVPSEFLGVDETVFPRVEDAPELSILVSQPAYYMSKVFPLQLEWVRDNMRLVRWIEVVGLGLN